MEQNKYVLRRLDDNLIVEGSRIKWIEWDENKMVLDWFDDISIGKSLIVDPEIMSYKWMTTTVTSIEANEENRILFKTENSTYELCSQQTKHAEDVII